MQGLLQIDDDLTLICKNQGDHAANPLIVDVSVTGIVDAVAGHFNRFEQGFCEIHEFGVGHYNLWMLLKNQILVRRLSLEGIRVSLGVAFVLGLSGCGQPGVLYLPTDPAATKGATRPASPNQPVPTQATPNPVDKVKP